MKTNRCRKISTAKFMPHKISFILLQHILNSSLYFWLILFTVCSKLFSDFRRLYRICIKTVLWKFSKAPLCIKQFTLWWKPTNYLIMLGLWDMFGCKGSGLPGLRHLEIQPGIIRQGKQLFNKGTTFQNKPRAVWAQLISWKPTSRGLWLACLWSVGGRLVESFTVDIGRRSSDGSAITIQWCVQRWGGSRTKGVMIKDECTQA